MSIAKKASTSPLSFQAKQVDLNPKLPRGSLYLLNGYNTFVTKRRANDKKAQEVSNSRRD